MPQAIPAGYKFGLKRRKIADESAVTRLGAETRIRAIPRSDWQPTPPEKKELVKTIYAQLDGHCAANACAGAVMFQRARQGLPHVILSPEALYATHSSWGSGSTLAENLQAAQEIGIPSRESMPPKNYRSLRDYGDAANEAMCYRVGESLDCGKGVELFATGLQIGLAGPIGVSWNHKPRSGHSILAVTLEYVKRRWMVGIANSWGEDNGDDGWDLLDLDLDIAPYMTGFGAWLIQSVIHDTWTAAK